MSNDLNLGDLGITINVSEGEPASAQFTLPDGSVVTRPFSNGELSMRLGLGLGLGYQAVVGGGSASAPSNTGLPVISGTAKSGQTLSATNGTWNDGGAGISGYAYQWSADGVAISGATSSTFGLTDTQIGAVITVTVTATNSAGSTSATSAGTDPAEATPEPKLPVMASSGVSGVSTGNWTPDQPTGIRTGDFLLIWAETANEAVTIPPGWTELSSSPQGTGLPSNQHDSTRLTIMWRIAEADAEAMPTIIDPGDHIIGRAMRFTGVDMIAPINAASGNVEGSVTAAVAIPGLTTTYPECLVIAVVANGNDAAVSSAPSSVANADLAGVTLQNNSSSAQSWGSFTATGNGGGAYFITGRKAAAGAVGPTTGTLATARPQARICFALKPA